jgi:TPR repeat protein
MYAGRMTANRLIRALLILWLATLPALRAQESVADHKQLDARKAQANTAEADALLAQAARYASGDAVPRDLAKAAKLHRKAADLGDARGECLLGLDYAYGEGVKKNMNEAARWLHKAADQGLADAEFDLAVLYANGEFEGRGIVDAAVLYRKAAEQGLPQAQTALGNCYLEGTGVPKSIPEGIKWTRKAAEQGFSGAQQALGICYAKGQGVETNLVQAYKWLALAAAKDNQNPDEIKVNLSRVERFMTPQQIAEGQKLASEFVPGKGDSQAPANAGTAAAPASTARMGVVNVKGNEADQEIYVNGAFVGNTPAKLKLAEGPHVIEVKKAGFKDYRRQVYVGDGSELTLNVVLAKQ